MITFDPQAWTPPKAPTLTGTYEENDLLASAARLPTGGVGPEDVVLTDDGFAYTGLDDGRILRFPAGSGDAAVVADTGGRPLGTELSGDGTLLVCDADRGLLRVAPTGEVTTLVDSFRGERFVFTNNAAIASDGAIYFTVTSTRYTVHLYVDDLLEHSGTGRLFAYRPDGTTELLLDGLQFANGVALDSNEDSVFVVETGSYRILRYWLAGEQSGKTDVFTDNLPGFPDNASFGNGILWLGLPSPRQMLVDKLMPRPWLRNLTNRLPDSTKPKALRHGMILGFDESGAVQHNLQDSTGSVAITTSARWHEGRLYIGSLQEPDVIVYDLG
ncbi:MAG: SMP-30/gluconolactonase/LRE family protein [Actinomycetota bacterium]|nr:SMP-30/gluconolactonase/LRE family protein [Actinomycetota bacterium]